MIPGDNKSVVVIVDKHGEYSVAFLLELCGKCFISTKDLQSIYVCVEFASKEPDRIERGVPTASKVAVSATLNPDLEAVKASTKRLNDRMNLFLVNPPGLKGKDIFSHMVGVCLTNTKATSPSKFLDVVVITSNIAVLKDAAEASTIKRKFMRDSGGLNETMKLAARNLDQMGYIKSHSGIVNSSKRLVNTRNQMYMPRSLDEIRAIETNDTVDKKKIYTESTIIIAPSANIQLISRSGDVMNIYKKINVFARSSLLQYIEREQYLQQETYG